MATNDHELTELLKVWSKGNKETCRHLFSLVYEELLKKASFLLKGERVDHTFGATALIHELYLRMASQERLSFSSRQQFFAFASKAMRYILVDHARLRARQKRGGDSVKTTFEDDLLAARGWEPEVFLSFDETLCRLKSLDTRKGQVFELWYFGGLNCREIGEQLAMSPETTRRDLRTARAWVSREMSQTRTCI